MIREMSIEPQSQHVSVLRKEVLEILSPQAGETVLDVTLGLGGHAVAFAEAIGESGMLIGLDADEENLKIAEKNLENASCSTRLIHTNFIDLPNLDLPKCDIIFADLGFSSPHVDDPARGFTFRENVPLDLRYDRTSGQTGAQLIANSSQEDVARILFRYGELRQSRKIADALKQEDIQTTGDVASCVESVLGYRTPKFLPQVFQALRIAVNRELEALDVLLDYGLTLLRPGGRMGILTYHSLEDRPVKQVFKRLCTPEKDERTGAIAVEAPFLPLIKKYIEPSANEIEQNPRSRSAKLRAVVYSGS